MEMNKLIKKIAALTGNSATEQEFFEERKL
jgi:hypothetical protein